MKTKSIITFTLTLMLIVGMTCGCIGDTKPVEANNSTVTYVTSNSPMDNNFWMYMYMAHMFDSTRPVYVEQHHYYSTHPTYSTYASSVSGTRVTYTKPVTKKQSFFSKTSNSIKSKTTKVSSSFKASKSSFKSSGSSYKSSGSSFRSSRSGFSSSRSSFRGGRR